MRKTLGMLMAAGMFAFAPAGAAFAEMSIEAALGEEEAAVMVIEVDEPAATDVDPYGIEFETGEDGAVPAEQGSADDLAPAPAAKEAPAVEDGKPAG